jgi:hypothetical protein
MRNREMDRFIRDHRDLEQAIADWARVHPHGTEADAITDLSLWPRPYDQGAQWLVWRELRQVRPVRAPVLRALPRPRNQS